ncbi:MAG: hypothetical protein NC485_09955 [Ruminococcus flavefaciens]|nr:hypothetical protein [Ruminococcus flavefaciens]
MTKNITYYLVEEIIEWYAPNFPINAQTVVALCDLSLIADNPIHGFFAFLEYFRKFDSNKVNARFMYECLENNNIYTMGGAFHVSEILDRQLNICYNAIDSFYISFDSKAKIGEWIKKLCNTGIEYRKKKFSCLCDVMDDSISVNDAQDVFLGIIKEIGLAIELNSGNNFKIPKSLRAEDFFQLIALEEYTTEKIDEANGKFHPCNLKRFCETFVRNDTISVGYGTRSLRCVQPKNLKKIDLVTRSVVNDTCNRPLQRDRYNNLFPFTYVCRNIDAINKC